MTVITPNGISGINSITAQSGTLEFYNASGSIMSVTGNVTGNVNSTGVSTFTTLRATNIVGVSTAGITTVYTNSFNGGQLGGSRNMIINGSMVVNQRGFTGTSGADIPASTAGTYPIDRFYVDNITDGAVSAGQTTMNSTVGGNAYADGFNNALICRVTTADTSLAAGQYSAVAQAIEGYNVQGIKKGTANAQPVTLSFWCRSTTTGTYIVELVDIDNTRYCSQSYTINSANTWEKKTVTFPADTTGVFDNDNNASLYVFWWFAAGSTYSGGGPLQTTWGSTNANRAVGQTNLLATVGNNFFLTGVQLEVGDRPTEFERRSFGQEFALCLRYYFAQTGLFVDTVGASYNTLSTIRYAHHIHGAPLLVPMRTSSPVVTYSMIMNGVTNVTSSYGVTVNNGYCIRWRNTNSGYATQGDLSLTYTLSAEL